MELGKRQSPLQTLLAGEKYHVTARDAQDQRKEDMNTDKTDMG